MATLLRGLGTSLAGWDPLGWVHDMDWYRDMLHAPWFQPIRPYWERYHLDWVVAFLLIIILLLIARVVVRKVRLKKIFRRKDEHPLRAAKEYLRMGELRLAAESFYQAGKLDRAFELFVKQEAWFNAAQVAEEMGQADQAADLYEKANDEMSAIRALRKAGKLERAHAIYRRLGQLTEAAKMYMEEGELLQAADLYQQAGHFGKAAAVLFEAGEDKRATDCLIKLVTESTAGYTTDETELLSRGAKVLTKAKQPDDAARLLQAAEMHEEAAELFVAAGSKQEAAACLAQAGHLQRAVDLYREIGDARKVYEVLRQIRSDGGVVDPKEWADAQASAGFHKEAADSFKQIGDVDAAVRTSLGGDRPQDAAVLLAESGQHTQAAQLFLEAGDPDAAHDQFLAAGDKKGAAQAGMQAGLYFEAGLNFIELGDWARAVDALQRVGEDHPRHREAASMVAQAFARLGDRDMAGRMHERATEGIKVDGEHLEMFYQMARFMEESAQASDRARARLIYADILAVQYTFRDVKKRHDDLEPAIGPQDLATVRRFGKYELIEQTGSGGMAKVFKARDTSRAGAGRFLAVKRIRSEFAQDSEFIDMLLDEAKIVAGLHHTNIAQIMDYGIIDGATFLAMEYVEGTNLRDIWRQQLSRGEPLAVAMAAYILAEVCMGLSYAHDKHGEDGINLAVVHRDISHENIMVSTAGSVKIIDFGIAKAANRLSETRTGILKGKFAYMSPEQVRGLPIDKRSDIFSTGIVLYELLSGEQLFVGDNDAATLENVRNAVVPPLAVTPAIPEQLLRIVMRALAKDPEERFPDAGDMHHELEELLSTDAWRFTRADLAAYMRAHHPGPAVQEDAVTQPDVALSEENTAEEKKSGETG